MNENSPTSSFGRAARFLSNVWRGIKAPEDIISKTRKRIDEVMLVTGVLGLAESFVLRSPVIFVASAADMGIGAADLARAGEKTRAPEVH